MNIELILFFQFICQLGLLAGAYAVTSEIYQSFKEWRNRNAK